MSSRSIKSAGLPVIHDRAAGIDIGARFHVVGVPPELCEQSVQTFQAFTGEIERMADWLVSIRAFGQRLPARFARPGCPAPLCSRCLKPRRTR